MTGPRWQEISDEPEYATREGSFHASLLKCTKEAAEPKPARSQVALSSHVAKPVTKSIATPIAKPVVKSVAEPAVEPIANPATMPVANAVVKSVSSSLAKPVTNAAPKPEAAALDRDWSWLTAQAEPTAARRIPASPKLRIKIKLPSFFRPAQPAQAARPVQLAKAVQAARQVRPASGLLGQIVGWLRSKYAMSVTKRLRVSEIVSLGEKRFVAVVCLEGREFLVGGGASGVSLLTSLGSPVEAAQPLRPEFSARGAYE